MKRVVKYWVDGQEMKYKQARKMPGFDPRFYTVEYKETWQDKKYRVRNKIITELLFWGVIVGMFAAAMYILFGYCL